MKLKRLYTSISAQFDNLITSVENHEAVAESLIKDVRQNTAKIHSQVAQNENKLDQLVCREEKLTTQISQWRSRAQECAELDRDKALACLAASKNCERELDRAQKEKASLISLSAELKSHLADAEQRLIELQSKKESLCARDRKNRIVDTANTIRSIGNESNDIFTRWEENVLCGEYGEHENLSADQKLDISFKQDEEKALLESELDSLIFSKKDFDRSEPKS